MNNNSGITEFWAVAWDAIWLMEDQNHDKKSCLCLLQLSPIEGVTENMDYDVHLYTHIMGKKRGNGKSMSGWSYDHIQDLITIDPEVFELDFFLYPLVNLHFHRHIIKTTWSIKNISLCL